METIHFKESKEKLMKTNPQSLRDLWDIIKGIKLCITWEPQKGRAEKKEAENIFEETTAKNSQI